MVLRPGSACEEGTIARAVATLPAPRGPPRWVPRGPPRCRSPDAVLNRIRPLLVDGDVAVVAHGHLARVLTVRGLGLDASASGVLGPTSRHAQLLGHRGRAAVHRRLECPVAAARCLTPAARGAPLQGLTGPGGAFRDSGAAHKRGRNHGAPSLRTCRIPPGPGRAVSVAHRGAAGSGAHIDVVAGGLGRTGGAGAGEVPPPVAVLDSLDRGAKGAGAASAAGGVSR